MLSVLFGLLPLIGKVAPLIAGMTSALASPVAGNILAKAGDIAKRIFGTTDAADIELQIQQDKSKLEMFKAQLEADTAVDLAFIADAQNARNQTQLFLDKGSSMAWGAPVLSIAVTSIFVVVTLVLINYELNLSEFQKGMVVPLIGIIGAAFGQVVNFWLGSTRSSKDKDSAIAAMATAPVVSENGAGGSTGRLFR